MSVGVAIKIALQAIQKLNRNIMPASLYQRSWTAGTSVLNWGPWGPRTMDLCIAECCNWKLMNLSTHSKQCCQPWIMPKKKKILIEARSCLWSRCWGLFLSRPRITTAFLALFSQDLCSCWTSWSYCLLNINRLRFLVIYIQEIVLVKVH